MALLLVSLVCWGAFTAGARGVFGAVPLLTSSSQPGGIRPPTALLQIPTAARCNRLYLPDSLANTSAVPSYPAAVKDPVSGEWLLFFTYQEVCVDAMFSNKLTMGVPQSREQPRASKLSVHRKAHVTTCAGTGDAAGPCPWRCLMIHSCLDKV